MNTSLFLLYMINVYYTLLSKTVSLFTQNCITFS